MTRSHTVWIVCVCAHVHVQGGGREGGRAVCANDFKRLFSIVHVFSCHQGIISHHIAWYIHVLYLNHGLTVEFNHLV